jgi:hypothetical protein
MDDYTRDQQLRVIPDQPKARRGDRVDEIADEISNLAWRLETKSRRLKTRCQERPTEHSVICELARSVAVAAERIASELRERSVVMALNEAAKAPVQLPLVNGNAGGK